jgi:Ca2+:H+ antiporter
MGMCFFFGGLNREQQFFNKTVAQTAASLLALAVGSLIIPTAYTWQGNFDATKSDNDEELSRGTAIILLIVYIAFLIFQLKSHKDLYNKPSPKVEKRNPSKSVKKMVAHLGGLAGASAGGHIQKDDRTAQKEQIDTPEEPTLTFIGSIVTLCAATALIGINAEFLVDSISDVTCKYKISEVFVGKSLYSHNIPSVIVFGI